MILLTVLVFVVFMIVFVIPCSVLLVAYCVCLSISVLRLLVVLCVCFVCLLDRSDRMIVASTPVIILFVPFPQAADT